MSEAAVETPADLGGETADVEAPEAVEDTPAVETETPTAAPDIAAILSSPEAREAIDRATEARLGEMFREEPEAQEPIADAIARLDPLDDNFAQQLAQVLDDREQKMIAQLQSSPSIQHADQEYARRWADDTFGTIEGSLGAGVSLDPEAREIAILAANGRGGGDPTETLTSSARQLHAYVEKRVQAGIAAYKAGLAGEGEGGNEPAAAGGPAMVRTEELPGSMSEATQRVLKRYGIERADTIA